MSTDYVWFWKKNPCFQKAHVFCMDLQPAADPYNVVCRFNGGCLGSCSLGLCRLLAAVGLGLSR